MSRNTHPKDVYAEYKENDKGEVTSSTRIVKLPSEPEYVKLYIDCVMTVKGVRKGLSPILLAFLPFMSYAQTDEPWGGQTIYVNSAMKKRVAERVGLSLDSVNKAITEFVKSGIFKRVAVGTYQVNPNIFGKGEWKDITNIQATFDFKNKRITANIVKDEEDAMTEQQAQLDADFERRVTDDNTGTNRTGTTG